MLNWTSCLGTHYYCNTLRVGWYDNAVWQSEIWMNDFSILFWQFCLCWIIMDNLTNQAGLCYKIFIFMINFDVNTHYTIFTILSDECLFLLSSYKDTVIREACRILKDSSHTLLYIYPLSMNFYPQVDVIELVNAKSTISFVSSSIRQYILYI